MQTKKAAAKEQSADLSREELDARFKQIIAETQRLHEENARRRAVPPGGKNGNGCYTC